LAVVPKPVRKPRVLTATSLAVSMHQSSAATEATCHREHSGRHLSAEQVSDKTKQDPEELPSFRNVS